MPRLQDCTVLVGRDAGGLGRVVLIEVSGLSADGEVARWAGEEDVSHLLTDARRLDARPMGPADGDWMPQDEWIVRAAAQDLGVEIEEEEDLDPILTRLSDLESALAAPGMSEVVTPEAVQTVSDAYETIESLLKALKAVVDRYAPSAAPANDAIAAMWAEARAAIAKAEGR